MYLLLKILLLFFSCQTCQKPTQSDPIARCKIKPTKSSLSFFYDIGEQISIVKSPNVNPTKLTLTPVTLSNPPNQLTPAILSNPPNQLTPAILSNPSNQLTPAIQFYQLYNPSKPIKSISSYSIKSYNLSKPIKSITLSNPTTSSNH
ncbi:unnamed protein product [Rhizophagus irregularis]|nr:unnamed protein product [Rhizophagus irregularis]CAB5373752.1 unnamed protein product [Rhizophagus irregularis]